MAGKYAGPVNVREYRITKTRAEFCITRVANEMYFNGIPSKVSPDISKVNFFCLQRKYMPDNCEEDRELLKTNLHLQMETGKAEK